MAVEITEEFVWQNIPRRARDSHKGTFGSVLAVPLPPAALLTAPLLPPHLYRSAFTNFHMGYSCALAWILVVIIGLAIAILFKTQNAWVHYEAE